MKRTFYITKYALSEGITCAELRVGARGALAFDKWNHACLIGSGCFDTWEEVLKNAEERRTREVVRLQKQVTHYQRRIGKLQAKTFEEPTP